MNKMSTALTALLMTASVGVMAETTSTTNTTREQRMNAALQDYRNGGASSDTSSSGMRRDGRVDRGEDSVAGSARRAGHAVANGGRKAGHVVAEGARKTGHAVHRAADKVTDKATGKTTTDVNAR